MQDKNSPALYSSGMPILRSFFLPRRTPIIQSCASDVVELSLRGFHGTTIVSHTHDTIEVLVPITSTTNANGDIIITENRLPLTWGDYRAHEPIPKEVTDPLKPKPVHQEPTSKTRFDIIEEGFDP